MPLLLFLSLLLLYTPSSSSLLLWLLSLLIATATVVVPVRVFRVEHDLVQKARIVQVDPALRTVGRAHKDVPVIGNEVVGGVAHGPGHQRERLLGEGADGARQSVEARGRLQDGVTFKVGRVGVEDEQETAGIVGMFAKVLQQGAARGGLQWCEPQGFGRVHVKAKVHRGVAKVANSVKQVNGATAAMSCSSCSSSCRLCFWCSSSIHGKDGRDGLLHKFRVQIGRLINVDLLLVVVTFRDSCCCSRACTNSTT